MSESKWRVIVEPRRIGDFGSVSVGSRLFYSDERSLQKAYKERCEEIVEEVRRHVDHVGWCGVEEVKEEEIEDGR
jgi:hypothetical protein